MEQKLVTFELAKVLKSSGFPQEARGPYCPLYTQNGELVGSIYHRPFSVEERPLILAPTYFDVGRWLWDEKDIKIMPQSQHRDLIVKQGSVTFRYCGEFADLEEAIVIGVNFVMLNEDSKFKVL